MNCQKLQHRTLQELMAAGDDKVRVKEDLSSNDWLDVTTEHDWLESSTGNNKDAIMVQHQCNCAIEVADTAKEEEEEEANKKLVRLFHVALEAGNVGALRSLLADSVEWWFHGAPHHQHLRRVLTGRRSVGSVRGQLVPLRMLAVGRDMVLVEGLSCGPQSATTSWAHVWTLRAGRLAQLREYWGVGLRVLRFQPDHLHHHHNNNNRNPDCANLQPRFVWESSLWSATACTPGLILTI